MDDLKTSITLVSILVPAVKAALKRQTLAYFTLHRVFQHQKHPEYNRYPLCFSQNHWLSVKYPLAFPALRWVLCIVGSVKTLLCAQVV